MGKFKIGQIVVTNRDVKTVREISEQEITIHKGEKAIVGPDQNMYHFNGVIREIPGRLMENGYDVDGLAEWICHYLSANCNDFNRMIEGRDDLAQEMKEYVAAALYNIGF